MEKKRKLIDLPEDVVRDFSLLAAVAGMSAKAYMQEVLISHTKRLRQTTSLPASHASLKKLVYKINERNG